MKQIECVTWSAVKSPETALTVTRIDPDNYPIYAAGVLGVLAQAYDRHFGNGETALLPDAAAYDVFDTTSNDAREAQVKKMTRYTEEGGSVYWAAYDTPYFTPGKDMIGVAKASPSRPGLRKIMGKPNCYVNDISTTEARMGTGSGLLWAALSDYDDKRMVVADVLQGNKRFFETAGLTSHHEIKDLDLGEYKIPQVRFRAVAVKGVRAALERNGPWLREHSVHVVRT